MIRDDKMTFEEAVIRFSQDKTTAMNAGMMANPNTGAGKFEYQDLPPEVARQIYDMNEGDLSQAFVMMDQQKNKEVCAIVRLKKKQDAHQANLTDDFQVIKTMLEEKLAAEFIDKWIRKKQQETYIHIDPAWRGCDFQYPGWGHGN